METDCDVEDMFAAIPKSHKRSKFYRKPWRKGSVLMEVDILSPRSSLVLYNLLSTALALSTTLTRYLVSTTLALSTALMLIATHIPLLVLPPVLPLRAPICAVNYLVWRFLLYHA